MQHVIVLTIKLIENHKINMVHLKNKTNDEIKDEKQEHGAGVFIYIGCWFKM